MVNVNGRKWVKCHGLAKAKGLQMQRVCKSKGFAKAKGLQKQRVCKSKWIYNSKYLLL